MPVSSFFPKRMSCSIGGKFWRISNMHNRVHSCSQNDMKSMKLYQPKKQKNSWTSTQPGFMTLEGQCTFWTGAKWMLLGTPHFARPHKVSGLFHGFPHRTWPKGWQRRWFTSFNTRWRLQLRNLGTMDLSCRLRKVLWQLRNPRNYKDDSHALGLQPRILFELRKPKQTSKSMCLRFVACLQKRCFSSEKKWLQRQSWMESGNQQYSCLLRV